MSKVIRVSFYENFTKAKPFAYITEYNYCGQKGLLFTGKRADSIYGYLQREIGLCSSCVRKDNWYPFQFFASIDINDENRDKILKKLIRFADSTADHRDLPYMQAVDNNN